MKYLRYFLIGGIALIGLSSSRLGDTKPSEGIYPGDLFADIKNITNISGTTVNLSDFKGQKVLVNLWAAYDATSHCDNVLLANAIAKNDYPVKMLSLSFDQSQSVFERTVTVDGLDKSSQFLLDESLQATLSDRFKLKKGFKNFLLDEGGKIVAINLSAEKLNQLMTEN